MCRASFLRKDRERDTTQDIEENIMEGKKQQDLFEEKYRGLNAEQRSAVDAIDGPVMVIAGPGSGKTELLSVRVANILRHRDAAPGNILCLTFTDAAAAEMRGRLIGLLGSAAYRVAVHTFHSFGLEIINRYPERFYGGAAFSLADDITQVEIMEEIFNGLEHGDPLRSEHDGNFVYLPKALKAIEQIKKAGLSPDDFERILAENKRAIDLIEPLARPIFKERVSKKIFAPARQLAEEVAALSTERHDGPFRPFAEYFAGSLNLALDTAEDEESTAPLTAWKSRYIKKGDDGEVHLADRLDEARFDSLASIYRSYVERMREEGYYDYGDMILDALAVIKRHAGVRSDLQERYRYILVDEFQDTNDAQMELLRLLADRPANDGRSNIMVVGDDDQAIFKFQGAELSNITGFRTRYPDAVVVILKANYRSTQSIIDAARRVIGQGSNRLERLIPEFRKELIAAGKDIKPGAIGGKEFLSRELEYQWVADEVKALRERDRIPGNQIAIVARGHRELTALVPYLHQARVPVAYDHEEDVLRSKPIMQLVQMARFVDSLMTGSGSADDLLPEILSYPFWGLKPVSVWEISVKASRERKPWLEVMRASGGILKGIADFFINLGAKARYATAEEVLHELIGDPQSLLADEDADGDEAMPSSRETFSPFRSYYFGAQRLEKKPAEYLAFLASLQSFVRALRDYRPGRPVTVRDMVVFVDMHIINRIPLNQVSQFSNDARAVQLMTAHKAKGREFEAVFVIDCEHDVWAGAGGNRDIPLPTNLPIGPAGEDRDDQLRLFYVAMTRAKRLLYLTASTRDIRGKQVDRLGFLVSEEGESPWVDFDYVDMGSGDRSPEDLLAAQWDAASLGPIAPDEKALLLPLLERYQLSVTHLQNFLDVVFAGPREFFEKNLLMFPQPKTASSGFGSAVHETIKRAYVHLKNAGSPASLDDVLTWFADSLGAQRLNRDDVARMLRRGQRMFAAYYPARMGQFSPRDIVEFDFKDQGVLVEGARLTGKVDRMSPKGDRMTVCDFKTSGAFTSWEPGGLFEKVKAWKYRQQIMFYKLLIENSRDYGGRFSVDEGYIEFVEPLREEIVDLSLAIDPEEVERLRMLIGIVYRKIQALDFPEVSGYSKDNRGIKAFENDLLNGKI
jgi:DNA helicase-2/ATP-dependent DNA helicase PcrA